MKIGKGGVRTQKINWGKKGEGQAKGINAQDGWIFFSVPEDALGGIDGKEIVKPELMRISLQFYNKDENERDLKVDMNEPLTARILELWKTCHLLL